MEEVEIDHEFNALRDAGMSDGSEAEKEEGEIEDGEIIDSQDEGGNAEVAEPTEENVQPSVPAAPLDLMGMLQRDLENGVEESGISLSRKKKKKKKKRKRPPSSQRHHSGEDGPEAGSDGMESLASLPPKPKKRKRYIDHDRIDDDFDDMWFPPRRNDSIEMESRLSQSPPLLPPIQRSLSKSPSPPGLYDSPPESSGDEYGGPSYDCPPKRGNAYPRFGVSMSSANMEALGTRDPSKPPIMLSGGGDFRQARNGSKRRRGGDKRGKGRSKGKRKEAPPRQICKFYLDGKCSKGTECTYSHDSPLTKKQELCKFYLNGFCAKSETCVYMHKEFPCKFFHTGAKCYSADKCKFSHDTLTDELKHILQKHLDKEDNPSDSDDSDDSDSSSLSGITSKPSLLGSPPRQSHDALKKIPSLFDIEVQPPQNIVPPPGGSTPQQQPARPNFYSETMTSPGAGSGQRPGLLPFPTSSFDPDQNDFPFDEDEIVPGFGSPKVPPGGAGPRFGSPKSFGGQHQPQGMEPQKMDSEDRFPMADDNKRPDYQQRRPMRPYNNNNRGGRQKSFNSAPWRNSSFGDVSQGTTNNDDAEDWDKETSGQDDTAVKMPSADDEWGSKTPAKEDGGGTAPSSNDYDWGNPAPAKNDWGKQTQANKPYDWGNPAPGNNDKGRQAPANKAYDWGNPAPAKKEYDWGNPAPAKKEYDWGNPAPVKKEYDWGNPAPAKKEYDWGNPAPGNNNRGRGGNNNWGRRNAQGGNNNWGRNAKSNEGWKKKAPFNDNWGKNAPANDSWNQRNAPANDSWNQRNAPVKEDLDAVVMGEEDWDKETTGNENGEKQLAGSEDWNKAVKEVSLNQPVKEAWNAPASEDWDNPSKENWDNPAKEDWDKPVQENWNKPVTNNWDKPAQENWNKPVTNNWNRPAKQDWNKPVKQAWNAPAKENWDNPVKEDWDNPAKEDWDNPAKEDWDKPAQDNWNKPAQDNWNKPAQDNWNKPATNNWNKPVTNNWNKPVKQEWNRPNNNDWNRPGKVEWNSQTAGTEDWDKEVASSEDWDKETSDNNKGDVSQSSEGSESEMNKGFDKGLVIPLHLPKKQRELFLRIQQQQRQAGLNQVNVDGKEPDVKTEEEEMWPLEDDKKEDENEDNEMKKAEADVWFSSDDDDDMDQPLTDVLKKLQQEPIKLAESAPKPPVINIAQMLKSIGAGITPPVDVKPPLITPEVNRDPRAQRLLEPRDPRSTPRNVNLAAEIRDPRVRARRDPRTPPIPALANLPQFGDPRKLFNIETEKPRVSALPLPPVPFQPELSPAVRPELDSNQTIYNTIPYQLRAVTLSLPNYGSILEKMDPKLVQSDPRLRRRLVAQQRRPSTEVAPPRRESTEAAHPRRESVESAPSEPRAKVPALFSVPTEQQVQVELEDFAKINSRFPKIHLKETPTKVHDIDKIRDYIRIEKSDQVRESKKIEEFDKIWQSVKIEGFDKIWESAKNLEPIVVQEPVKVEKCDKVRELPEEKPPESVKTEKPESVKVEKSEDAEESTTMDETVAPVGKTEPGPAVASPNGAAQQPEPDLDTSANEKYISLIELNDDSDSDDNDLVIIVPDANDTEPAKNESGAANKPDEPVVIGTKKASKVSPKKEPKARACKRPAAAVPAKEQDDCVVTGVKLVVKKPKLLALKRKATLDYASPLDCGSAGQDAETTYIVGRSPKKNAKSPKKSSPKNAKGGAKSSPKTPKGNAKNSPKTPKNNVKSSPDAPKDGVKSSPETPNVSPDSLPRPAIPKLLIKKIGKTVIKSTLVVPPDIPPPPPLVERTNSLSPPGGVDIRPPSPEKGGDEVDEDDNKCLKDIFMTIDPTASPFC